MNATFLSQKTKPLAFRRGQLKQLLKGMKEMNDDFGAAIKSDLGYNEFTHFMINQSITEMAI
jgi:aldehyde dehydrogenase (NAD+)